jgi:hypothetical protein
MGEKLSNFGELIAKAKADIEKRSDADVPIVIGGEVVDLVVASFDARDWANLTAVHPPRDGSVTDTRLGYNTDAVAEDALPLCGFRRVGDELVKLTDDECGDLFGYRVDAKTKAKERVRGVLSADDRNTIATVMWGLNVFEPLQRVMEAKKVLAAKPQKKQRSPASLVSLSED